MTHNRMFLIFTWFFILFFPLEALPEQNFPVFYKERIHPAEAYAQLWFDDIHHTSSPQEESLVLQPHQPLVSLLWEKEISNLKTVVHPQDSAFITRSNELKRSSTSSLEIASILEREFPISHRLIQTHSLFFALPSRIHPGVWLPLSALALNTFNPNNRELSLVGNFTLYSDEQFSALQSTYLNIRNITQEGITDIKETTGILGHLLFDAYANTLAGKISQTAHEKQLFYPTTRQLKAESFLIKFPWITVLIISYGLASCLLLSTFFWPIKAFKRIGFFTLLISFIIHSTLLGLRIYILDRPPVSNMFETVIYVPWVTLLITLLIPFFRHNPLILSAAAFSATILLIITKIAQLHQSLNQVQAVLDSRFWLVTHVLMVVGSYGLFLLASLLGHLYLFLSLVLKQSMLSLSWLTQRILHILYGGTLFLITGTILGGVWAAESWGRFWDWDPKESWAFVSSCLYLVFIHAYRFRKIGNFGLAIGAITGFLAISFTWYGVNYLLGAGLHTYGFGSGGEFIYFGFCAIELTLISVSIRLFKKIT